MHDFISDIKPKNLFFNQKKYFQFTQDERELLYGVHLSLTMLKFFLKDNCVNATQD